MQNTANVDLDVGRSIWDRTGSFLAAEAPRSNDVRLVDYSSGTIDIAPRGFMLLLRSLSSAK